MEDLYVAIHGTGELDGLLRAEHRRQQQADQQPVHVNPPVRSEQNYYEPDNSYLNHVLDRGPAIHTLCLFYMLLARRLRLPVNRHRPAGHSICRHRSVSGRSRGRLDHGRLLTKLDCVHYLVRRNDDLRQISRPSQSPPDFLRISSDLRQIYLEFGLKDDATRLQRYLVALGVHFPNPHPPRNK